MHFAFNQCDFFMLLLTDFDHSQNWLYSWIMCIFIVHQVVKIHISFIDLSFLFIEFVICENKLYLLKLFWEQQNSKLICDLFVICIHEQILWLLCQCVRLLILLARLICDLEVKLWQVLNSLCLLMCQLLCDHEVLQIFMIC